VAGARRVGFLFTALTGAALAQACSTVMYVRTPESRIYTGAVYASSRPFFFFGLVGPTQDIFVHEICLGKEADQISTEYTSSDFFKTLVTLGIYSPRTVKIWCQL
jgi:hypothetical protein